MGPWKVRARSNTATMVRRSTRAIVSRDGRSHPRVRPGPLPHTRRPTAPVRRFERSVSASPHVKGLPEMLLSHWPHEPSGVHRIHRDVVLHVHEGRFVKPRRRSRNGVRCSIRRLSDRCFDLATGKTRPRIRETVSTWPWICGIEHVLVDTRYPCSTGN